MRREERGADRKINVGNSWRYDTVKMSQGLGYLLSSLTQVLYSVHTYCTVLYPGARKSQASQPICGPTSDVLLNGRDLGTMLRKTGVERPVQISTSPRIFSSTELDLT